MTCPECSSEMKLRTGSFGQFWGCTGYPDCRKTMKYSPGASVKDGPKVMKKSGIGALNLGSAVTSQAVNMIEGSPEQKAIWEILLYSSSHVAVNAVAGSGKSFTLVQAVLRMAERSRQVRGIVVAFNKHIAVEMKSKLPVDSGFESLTYHGLGLRAIKKAFGWKVKTDGYKMYRIAEQVGAKENLLDHKKWKEISNAVLKLSGLCKGSLLDGKRGELELLADNHELDIQGEVELAYDLVPECLKRSYAQTDIIDFDDMIAMPIVLELDFDPIDELMVDEFQDTNSAQHQLAIRAAGDSARVTVVGDRFQSIYRFRGAHESSIDVMVEELSSTPRGCVEMPLTVTRRCPVSHVQLAQRLVPQIQALDDAPEGKISSMPLQEAVKIMQPGDMGLCRVNKHLIGVAYALIKRGVKVVVRGRDIGVGITDLVLKLQAISIPDLAKRLSSYAIQEEARLHAMGKKGEGRLAALIQKVDCLEELMIGMDSIQALTTRIGELFEDFNAEGKPNNKVVLGTVHRCVHPTTFTETSKGLQRISDIAESGCIGAPTGIKPYQDKFTKRVGKTIKITTKRGYSLEMSPEHGITVWDSKEHVRREARHLVIGDWVRLKLGATVVHTKPVELPKPPANLYHNVKLYPIPTQMSDELAEFIGLIVADGTVFSRGVRVIKQYQSVVDRFVELAKILFNVTAHSGTTYVSNPMPRAEINSSQISKWLLSIGGLAPNEKYVPRIILEASLSAQRAFLRGLFEDGTVNTRGNLIDHLHFDNKTFEVCQVVQTMLLRLGIASSVRDCSRRGIVYLYSDAAKKFAQEIGFISGEKNKLLREGHFRPDTALLIPVTQEETAALKLYLKEKDYHNARGRGYISRSVAQSCLDQDSSIQFLAERMNWVYQKITAIEEGYAATICVTVPDGGQFLQNGFDGWNSKGLEALRIFVIAPELMPHPMAKKDKQTEKNIAYIAATRSKFEWIDKELGEYRGGELIWCGEEPTLFAKNSNTEKEEEYED